MTTKKRILFVFVIFIFLNIQSVIQGSIDGGEEKSVSKKALKLMKKADKEMKAEMVDKALDLYKKVIYLAPDYALPYFRMGQIYFNQKNYEQAAGFLEKAVNRKVNYFEAIDVLAQSLFLVGQSRINARKITEANQYFQKIIEIQGIEKSGTVILPKALFMLGVNHSQLKDLKTSNGFFLKITQIPDIEKKDLKIFAITLFNLGVNLTQLNKPEEAEKYLIKYLVIQTENPTDQYIPIANLILGMNSYKLLEKKLEEIKKNNQIKNPKEKISILAKKKGKIETYLKKAIELRSDIEQAHVTLGNYYYLCQDIKKALDIYKTVIEKFPRSKNISAYHSFIEQLINELPEKR